MHCIEVLPSYLHPPTTLDLDLENACSDAIIDFKTGESLFHTNLFVKTQS